MSERDLRVPSHRRLDTTGHPTEAELAPQVHALMDGDDLGLKVVCLRSDPVGQGLGYCGLIASDKTPAGEFEVAYEFMRSAWGHGYATEAASAVIEAALAAGHTRFWATVRDWNTTSFRVLEKLGFIPSGKVDPDHRHGDSVHMVLERHRTEL